MENMAIVHNRYGQKLVRLDENTEYILLCLIEVL